MKISRIISRATGAALALSLLTASLAACNPPKEPVSTDPATTAPIKMEETTSTTEVTDTSETETEEVSSPHMELTSGVKIFCPTRRNRTLYKLSTALATRIQEKTGIKLSIRYGGDDNAPAESEIILGYSLERPITTEAYESIATNTYGVYTVGKTAVLTAWSEDDIEAAADLFIESSLTQDGDRWFILPRTSESAADTAPVVALSAYRIVYAEGADDSVVNTYIPAMQAYLLKTYGVEIQAVSDSEEPSDREIIVGNTNRASETVQAYADTIATLAPYRYMTIYDGNNIFVMGGSEQATAVALSRAMAAAEQPELGPLVPTIAAEAYISPEMITEDKAELAEGAELRIMSYNILNQDYVPDNPLPEMRDNQLAEILLYYAPDVIGIQEANIDWHISFETFLPNYAQACKYHDGKHTAQTTFLYNPNTVKLIDEYVIHYTDWDDSDIRVVSFAVFERLASGERFVMTNTHPAPHAQHYSGHMVELNRILTEELAKYQDLPIIMTGDFNTNENQTEYTTLMTTQNVVDAKYDAEVLVRYIRTYTSLPSGEAVGGAINPCNGGSIDHIFINDRVDSKLFNVIVDHDVVHISDHLPIYADVILN